MLDPDTLDALALRVAELVAGCAAPASLVDADAVASS